MYNVYYFHSDKYRIVIEISNAIAEILDTNDLNLCNSIFCFSSDKCLT